MKKFLQKKLKEQKGMTLIELLAVIVIIAIIAAIAIPAIGNIIDNSRVGAIKSDALNIISAAELFETDTNGGTTVTLTTAGQVSLFELEDGGYIDDAGSFEGLTEAQKKAVNFKLASNQLTGTNLAVGGITVAFVDATKANVNALPNNAENGAYTANPAFPSGTTITVAGR